MEPVLSSSSDEEEESAAALRLLAELQATHVDEQDACGGAPLSRPGSPIGSRIGSSDPDEDALSDTDEAALNILAAARAAFDDHMGDEEEDEGNRPDVQDVYNGGRRDEFGPFSLRGNWVVHGLTWMDAATGNGLPLVDRVVQILEKNSWCWQIDFSNAADPSSTWFHLQPATVTHERAHALAAKVSSVIGQDCRGLAKGSLLPEAQQRRDRFIFLQEFTYMWNMSRGWCAGPCTLGDAPLRFTAKGLVGCKSADGNWSEVGPVFTAQRRYNECMHQRWNISGVMHATCNSHLSSHPFRAFSTERVSEPDLPPYLLEGAGGGVSGHWTDTVGAGSISLSFDHRFSRATNQERLSNWLKSHGYVHTPGCAFQHGGRHRRIEDVSPDNACPACRKRVELLELLGPLPPPTRRPNGRLR
jgi:hypothetical protein